jgi:hypothetical protein
MNDYEIVSFLYGMACGLIIAGIIAEILILISMLIW